jgi:formylglycine-generating enzyme required for sulfatase activity
VGENPSRFQGADRPVEQVSFDDVQGFLGRANQRESDLNLRLPTEAEWEYACRAGSTTAYAFGNELSDLVANFDGKVGETVPVESYGPNAWGLYQMHGNVFEWCADWWGPYSPERAVDPKGPDVGSFRVFRGGSWFVSARRCRSPYRRGWRVVPGSRFVDLGFRLARGPE